MKIFGLVLGLLLTQNSSLLTQIPNHFPIPKEIVDILKSRPDANECINDKESGGLEGNFEASPLKLSPNAPVTLVTGTNARCSCGATGNCLSYFFDRTKNGYRLIWEDGGNGFTILKTSHNGYFDLETSMHASAFYSVGSILEFDGNGYREVRCFTRQYEYISVRSTGEEQSKSLDPPEEVSYKCGQRFVEPLIKRPGD